MASVNFMKMKSAGQAKAIIRHCDPVERVSAKEHANKQIDKTKTRYNKKLYRSDYRETCERYDRRIIELDSTTNTNKRKDRVTLFSLEVPAPDGIPKDKEAAWFKDVIDIMILRYGKKNVLQGYVHLDERHEYTDAATGKQQMSRTHAHFFVVPEVNGKLNGKAFSSRKGMNELNAAIHTMTHDKYGLDFMTGSKRKSKKTVEELKNESAYAEIERKQAILDMKIREAEEIMSKAENTLRTLNRVSEAHHKIVMQEKTNLGVLRQEVSTLKRSDDRFVGLDTSSIMSKNETKSLDFEQ